MHPGAYAQVALAAAMATVLVFATGCGDKKTTHDVRAVVHAFEQEGIHLADERGSGAPNDHSATLTGDVNGVVIVLVEPSSAYVNRIVRRLRAKRVRDMLLQKDNVVVVPSSAARSSIGQLRRALARL